ncbi:MAG TPA: ROK family protein, partial [Bacillota bacterium]|nr:ROK family protein [Bacillota bacterium]
MATYAEWKRSNLGNKGSFVYITISTGISCAIINNGTFIRGEGFAGEVGSLPVLNPFASGLITLEQASSGVAMEKAARQWFHNPDMSTKDFFEAFKQGNDLAQTLMKKIIAPLAYGVYSIVTILDPQKIVFGGGVVNHNPVMLDLIKEGMKEYSTSIYRKSVDKLQLSQLKGDAGLTGAGLKAKEASIIT